jgi:hypothetical protein
MGFDVEGARKAGYSEPEIVDHLAKQSNFDVAGAKKAGYSDAEILQHLSTAASAPESRGVAGEPAAPAPATAAAPGRQPRKGVLKNQPEAEVQIPTLAEVGQQWRDVAVGAPKGAVTAIPGFPFDVAELVGFPNEYTSSKMADYMFGPAASPYEAGGRAFGGAITGFATPGIAGRIGAVKEAAAAANAPKTALALRAAQMAVDPLTPMLSGTVTLGGKAYNALRDAANYVLAPELTGANRLARATRDQPAALRAMQNTENMLTSGGPVNVGERLVEGGVAEPRVLAMQNALAEGKTAPLVQEAQQERVAAIQGNLQNVGDRARITARELTPAEAASPEAIQAALERQVAAEDARLQAAGGQVAGQIPNPSQQAVGQRLTEIAATGARETAANVVQPAYAAVIREAGDVPINLDRPLAAAQAVRGSATGIMDASTVPQGIRALEEFRAAPLPGEAIPSVIPGLPGRTGAPIPQPSTVTPAEFMDVRAELARDLRDAQRANNFPAVRHMRGILAEMDTAFAQSGVTPRTLELYADAGRLHGTETVARSRTGETAQMLQPGANNRPQLLPENVVEAFLKGETSAAQFGTTFRNDPAAAARMGEGVGGKFREAVIGADGMVDAEKASAFVRAHRAQLDILETSGVRITDQLAAITEQAATNARQRQAFAESSAVFRNAEGADAVIDTALSTAPRMDFLTRQLNADQRAGLVANIKNRALDPIKAGNPDDAIKFLTENQQTIQRAIGRTGEAEHTTLLNTARVQKRLQELQKTVPSEGIYDPRVLASKFSPSQLADLDLAARDIARLKQAETVAEAGKGARVAPPPAQWGELFSGVNSINPLILAKVFGGKFIKNALDARATAGAFDAIYRNPQKYMAALEDAIKMKKRGEVAQKAARAISNNLISRPAVSVSNALAPQEAP